MSSGFLNYPAAKILAQLAKEPFDLAKEGNVTPARIEEYLAEACGYRFYYATERIDHQVMRTLQDLALEAGALDKMTRLQSGEVMNFIQGQSSENRQALHTATRDFFEHQNPSEIARAAAQEAFKELEKLKQFLDVLDRENKFTDLVSIGIGGSDLGPRATYHALEMLSKTNRRVHFISNVDPDDTVSTMQNLNLEKTLVVVISKSGTTLETAANEFFVRKYFLDAHLDPSKHFISVTGKGSPMDLPERYFERFYIWDWIGGRFSTTSMVGGVPLGFAFGFEVFEQLLKGAHEMDRVALSTEGKRNLPLLGALLEIWNHNFLGTSTAAFIPYSQPLHRYPAHLQQVAMESNGKRIDQQGNVLSFQTSPIVWGEPGTNAQHSFFQLLHQGTQIVPIEFVGYYTSQSGQDFDYQGTTAQEKLLSNLIAQSLALALGKHDVNPNKTFPGNRPSHILIGEKLTPFSLGALLAYLEHKVAFEGFIWGINSFDQEGVQLGKVLANKVLEVFLNKKKGKSSPYPLADPFLR